MRYFFLAYLLLAVTIVGIAGFRGDKFTHTPLEFIDDMDHQAKVKAQSSNYFFADGHGARLPVVGTVAMGASIPNKLAAEGYRDPDGFSAGHGSDYYNTGKMENGTFWGDGFPDGLTINEAFLRRGQQVYNIHCAVCHGKSGNGKGVLALRQDTPNAAYGIANIANFLDPVFTDKTNAAYKPAGSIFNTITYGQGLMGRYGDKINVPDRWATIAYIRSMALSRNAPLSDASVSKAVEAAKAAGHIKE
jgi:prepilin-type processing-associated H-X9-DG protein